MQIRTKNDLLSAPCSKSCYENQVLNDPSIAGKLVYSFVIGLKGRVTSVKIVESTLNDPIV